MSSDMFPDAAVSYLLAMAASEEIGEDVLRECGNQLHKWGDQSHPDGTGEKFAHSRDFVRGVCETKFAEGRGTWRDILREEVYEALAERDAAKLRTELIQVAAVAISWVRDIDSREESNTD